MRIWCDNAIKVPLPKPSDEPTMGPSLAQNTDGPSSPYEKTISPESGATLVPTEAPAESSDASRVDIYIDLFPFLVDITPVPISESPTASNPTQQPTTNPVTVNPTKTPTLNPVTENPTKQPIRRPSDTPSVAPTEQPTSFPTISPSQSPTRDPTQPPTKTPSHSPTDGPSKSPTSSPSKGPSLSPSKSPSDLPTMFPSEIPSESPTSSPTEVMSISRFMLRLLTNPVTDSIDKDELSSILSAHLLNEMQSTFTSAEVRRIKVAMEPWGRSRMRQLNHRVRLLRKELESDSEDVQGTVHQFTVSGSAYLAGSSLPATKEVDAVIFASFDGVSGQELMHSLEKANDGGLQSVWSISVSEPTNNDGGDMNYLVSYDEVDQRSKPMYIFGILFGVGFLLVAIYFLKACKRMHSAMADDCRCPEYPPTYIEVEHSAAKQEGVGNATLVVNTEPECSAPRSLYESVREAVSAGEEAAPSSGEAENNITQKTQATWHSLNSKTEDTNLEIAPDLVNASYQGSHSQNTTLSETFSVFPSEHQSVHSGMSEGWALCGKNCKHNMPQWNNVKQTNADSITERKKTQSPEVAKAKDVICVCGADDEICGADDEITGSGSQTMTRTTEDTHTLNSMDLFSEDHEREQMKEKKQP
ncbi:hypothetical protein ACHAWF_008342 [Thalassiosira exigua]